MRLRAILREAARNILSGTTRATVLAVLLSVLAGGLTIADLSTVRSIADSARAFRDAGGSVLTFAAADRIDGRLCEQLGTVSGVRAAGAVRTAEAGIAPDALPSSTVPVLEVTPGFPRILRPVPKAGAGVFLSAQVAEALAVEAGESFPSRAGPTTVAGVYDYPADGRRSGYGYAALVPVSDTAPFEECWVDVWPASAEVPVLLRLTLLPADGDAEQPVLSQLNTAHGADFDGHERFQERITRYGAPAAAVLAAGLGFVAVRLRRVQLASALHAGVSRGALAATLALETLAWTIPALVLTSAVVMVFSATGPPSDESATVLLGARIGVPAVAGAFAGVVTSLLLTRERHLFRYFAER